MFLAPGSVGQVGNPHAPGKGVAPNLADIFGNSADSGYYPVSPAYCFKDTAGTVPCTADGDLIACRKPQFGAAPWLLQVSDSLKPVLKDDGGGKWRADWDGLDDTMVSAADSMSVDKEHLIAAALSRASNSATVLFTVTLSGSSVNYHRLSNIGSGGRMSGASRTTADGAVTALPATANTFPLSTPLVASTIIGAVNTDIQNDLGAPSATQATAFTTPLTGMQFVVNSAGSALSDWGISILKATTISPADRNAIIKALAARQGRTL